jgi:hypothetical protein
VERWLPRHRRWIGTTTAIFVALLQTLTPHASEPMLGDEFLQRVVAEVTRPNVTLKAIRELRAGTLSGKHQGWMNVETIIDASNGFNWRVIDEGGSERTRKQVLQKMMRVEAEAAQRGSEDAAALTPANYSFHRLPSTRPGQFDIALEPRREDPRLIVGTLTVRSNGTPIRLEGRLAKSPSFWVKSVTVVKRYESIGGVSLPTTLESIADVKFVGQSSISMQYRYREVNGHAIAASLHTTPELSFSPSREILALARASTRN